jgi:hypothetical protein
MWHLSRRLEAGRLNHPKARPHGGLFVARGAGKTSRHSAEDEKYRGLIQTFSTPPMTDGESKFAQINFKQGSNS